MSRPNKKLLQKLKDREYREEFLNTTVRGGIAYQVQALRRQDGSTQAEFADKVGKKQAQISRLESTEYGGVAVQTLIDIAAALGIGLLVRFVDLAQMLERTEDMSDAALMATPIDKLSSGPASTNPAPMMFSTKGFRDQLGGNDTWRPMISNQPLLMLNAIFNESLRTNYPREGRKGFAMSTLTTSTFDRTSSTSH